ncbi:MAG: acetolactate synthase small subunit [Clostridioides sp.]|jgi:acetolactate synthase-1/3 small subunit|nr:acetolactate synthase small subunit [Clostridioides sp.]
MDVKRFTLSIIVENKPGVLTRVSGLFSKRGYNIDSLYVSHLPEDVQFSRIIVTSSGDDDTREQIVKQVDKLHDVKDVKII